MSVIKFLIEAEDTEPEDIIYLASNVTNQSDEEVLSQIGQREPNSSTFIADAIAIDLMDGAQTDDGKIFAEAFFSFIKMEDVGPVIEWIVGWSYACGVRHGKELNDQIKKEKTPDLIWVLDTLSKVPDKKYVSQDFFLNTEEIKSHSCKVMRLLSKLSIGKEKLVESHSLVQYKEKKENYERRMIYNNLDFFVSDGLISKEDTEGYVDYIALKQKLSSEQKQKIGWVEDDILRRKKLEEFIQVNVEGPVKNSTQSVYRITDKGRERLEELQYQKIL